MVVSEDDGSDGLQPPQSGESTATQQTQVTCPKVIKPETTLTYSLGSAVSAFFIWGGWGYFVNSRSPDPTAASPVLSGLIQGTGSFLITLIIVKSVTFLYHQLAAHSLRLILPAAITTTVTVSCMSVAHVMAGTSQLLATIAPGAIVAFCFNMLTTFNLSRAEARLKQDP